MSTVKHLLRRAAIIIFFLLLHASHVLSQLTDVNDSLSIFIVQQCNPVSLLKTQGDANQGWGGLLRTLVHPEDGLRTNNRDLVHSSKRSDLRLDLEDHWP